MIEKFDIRYFSKIVSVERNSKNVMLRYVKSNFKVLKEKCDFLILTPPMPAFINAISNPTNEEKELFTTLTPHTFVATLMKEKGAIRNRPITYYQETLDKKIDGGVVADGSLQDALNYCSTDCPLNIEDYNNHTGFERHLLQPSFNLEERRSVKRCQIILLENIMRKVSTHPV